MQLFEVVVEVGRLLPVAGNAEQGLAQFGVKGGQQHTGKGTAQLLQLQANGGLSPAGAEGPHDGLGACV
jgi:hypothetical protein